MSAAWLKCVQCAAVISNMLCCMSGVGAHVYLRLNDNTYIYIYTYPYINIYNDK